ncbi:multicopper oxidase/laccase [Schizophyllum fasciatum]
MVSMFSALCASAALLHTAYAATVLPSNASMAITSGPVSPDGVERVAVLVNDEFPSPLIKATKGDQFRLEVSDRLSPSEMIRENMDFATSIHWHGFFQRGTNYADGVAYVTQCPIMPGEKFTYRFADDDNKAGTYWYHSHFDLQYCDGLRGPLVVYDPEDPYQDDYDVDDESTVLTLADWYHTPARVQPGGPFFSDSTLINGKGRSVKDFTAPLANITVEQGKRYRFRLISLACEPNYVFSIDGHNMTIIEADGQLTEPLTVNEIQIFPGQRYSFILNATQPSDNYWMRAVPSLALHGTNETANFTGGLNSAILHYEGVSLDDPKTNSSQDRIPLREPDLRALQDPAAPGTPEYGVDVQSVNLTMGFDGQYFLVNGRPFKGPTTGMPPYLLQILSGAQKAQDLLPQESIVDIKRGSVVEVTILPDMSGMAGAPHPMHLHGHAFSVVRSAGSEEFNWENPVRRDVVSTGNTTEGPGAGAVIRFVADNPGPWFLHCHIDPHLQGGLAVVFAEGVDAAAAANPPPADWAQLCPVWNTFFGSFNRPVDGPAANMLQNATLDSDFD